MSPALLTAIDSTSHVHLVIGSNPLAGARCNRSVEVGARPILIAPEVTSLHHGLSKRIDDASVKWIKREFQDEDLTSLGREEVEHVVDAVFVTLGTKSALGRHIASTCRRLRIPVNVADSPTLSTFTLLSTHSSGPLQIGVTTAGRGCHLASRIRREIASSLPSNLGPAVERLGMVRQRIWEEDHAAELAADMDAEEDDAGQASTFNKLVTPEDIEAARTRRMRWLGQICEYWPLRRLASITDDDVETILRSYTTEHQGPPKNNNRPPMNSSLSFAPNNSAVPPPILEASVLDRRTRPARILLAGSGPGHPDLLTTATLKAIRSADVILADKLVPAAVLELIPRRTPVHIARKFPGNAEQ
ncbi:uroporphyrin-III C-methyltransferase, partial [Elasticomyces elasticus]